MARSSNRISRRCPPLGCSRTLTIAVLPLLIYVCQVFGKASGMAATLAGMLVVLKVLIEWHQQHRPQASRQPRAPQAPIAGCYLCQRVQVLHPYHIEGMRVGVCSSCQCSLKRSRRWTT